MAIKKRTIVLSDTSAHTLGLGAAYGRVVRADVLSSSDTSVSLAVVDADSVTVGTWASADYTTIARRYLGPVETDIYDAGGDASANTEGQAIGLVAKSPLTLTASDMGAGTLTVDVYVEV